MRMVFFSLRNFKKDGGGTIRMYGILNALAKSGKEIVFISNASNYENFDDSIKHIYIDYEVNAKQKAMLQGLLSVLPVQIVFFIFKPLFKKVKNTLEEAKITNGEVFFFEYLDNSVAYMLKKKGLIKSYINDIHGVTPIEFSYQMNTAKNINQYLTNWIKYKSSILLDKKVFNYGNGFIYASEKMKSFYDNINRNMILQKEYIIPNLLDEKVKKSKVDFQIKKNVQSTHKIDEEDFVFFFAGGYKPTSGVDDLIKAFYKVSSVKKNIKLILIGAGPLMSECKNLADDYSLNDKIIFIESIPYEQLITYQSFADVIVCPDKQNPYSNLIVHLKYFDSLASGKLVINGNFESVREINKDDFLSLTFDPSNVDSLKSVMLKCINDYDFLTEKYKNSKEYALSNLTYKSYVDKIDI